MHLTRPLVFFDLETTGTNIASDRIVQIGAVKIFPDGKQEEKNVLLNPTIPIPKEVSSIHGITDEMVKDKPTFRQIAKNFAIWLEGSDLAGFNSDNFDIPLLVEEFLRVGIDFPYKDTHFVDMLKIERIVNSHRLGDTYERYTGEVLENAHDAMADVKATIAIFEKQMEYHEEFQASIQEIAELCSGENKKVDFAGKMFEKNGLVYWNFGKEYGKLVSETVDYARWVLKGDFAQDTKKHIQRIIDGK